MHKRVFFLFVGLVVFVAGYVLPVFLPRSVQFNPIPTGAQLDQYNQSIAEVENEEELET